MVRGVNNIMASSKKWFLGFVIVALLAASAAGQVRAETAKKLAATAGVKHLHYIVECSPMIFEDRSDMNFIAWANIPGHDSGQTIEEGGKPDWTVFGRTEEEAAEKLIAALQGPPTTFPKHAEPEKPKKQCAKPLEGGGRD